MFIYMMQMIRVLQAEVSALHYQMQVSEKIASELELRCNLLQEELLEVTTKRDEWDEWQ